jgi:hypothetical protein
METALTIPQLYDLLERLAANADEQKRYRDAAEIRDGMKTLDAMKMMPTSTTLGRIAKGDLEDALNDPEGSRAAWWLELPAR